MTTQTLSPTALKPGIFKLDGQLYKVQPNRAKTRTYAKRLVIINSTRLAESGKTVTFEYEYAPGIVFKLAEEHRLTKAEATDFGLQYGRCAWCGRTLKVAESVERGVGPVCWSRFA